MGTSQIFFIKCIPAMCLVVSYGYLTPLGTNQQRKTTKVDPEQCSCCVYIYMPKLQDTIFLLQTNQSFPLQQFTCWNEIPFDQITIIIDLLMKGEKRIKVYLKITPIKCIWIQQMQAEEQMFSQWSYFDFCLSTYSSSSFLFSVNLF